MQKSFAAFFAILFIFSSFCSAFQHQYHAFRRGFRLTMTSDKDASMGNYLSKTKPVFVAGGSRGLGFEVVKKLVKLGVPVHALVRSQEAGELLNSMDGVTVTIGDAFNEADIQKSMNGCVAAVTTLGGTGDDGQRIDYIGNSNVVEQAGILGVERIILVTSIGCGESKAAITKDTYLSLESFLSEKDKAERDIKLYTNLDWTIVRPGGLKSEPMTGKSNNNYIIV